MTEKTCRTCGETKPVSLMAWGGTKGDLCKDCRNASIRAATVAAREADGDRLVCPLAWECYVCQRRFPFYVYALRRTQYGVPYRIRKCRDCVNEYARVQQTRKRDAEKQSRLPRPIPTTRTCKQCGVEKPLNQFMHQPTDFRYQALPPAWCKSCFSARVNAEGRARRDAAKTQANPRWREELAEQRASAAERARERAQRWKQNNPDKVRETNKRRRARKQGASVAVKVNRAAIIERDHSTCYLCGRELKAHDITLDHVVPLARGGTHTPDNMRVACNRCNGRKQARLLSELDLREFRARPS